VADDGLPSARVRRSRRQDGARCSPCPLRARRPDRAVATSTHARGDISLLTSLAAQLAVAGLNARLHGRSKGSAGAHDVLATERQASRQVNASTRSRSFAQNLSLDTTLDAVTTTIVTVLDVDAVIRVPTSAATSSHRVPCVADTRPPGRYGRSSTVHNAVLRATGAPRLLPRQRASVARTRCWSVPREADGGALPITAAGELLAELTILSLDPAEPIDADTLATARTIAQQAALAIDNARLYQQQKQFAETMQQSLLPRERPDVAGLEVGTVYESAAQVDVGGDVFDFMELPDGRLAVVPGNHHGIDAIAWRWRVRLSLAGPRASGRRTPRHANDVVGRSPSASSSRWRTRITRGYRRLRERRSSRTTARPPRRTRRRCSAVASHSSTRRGV
jgi:hypothetical protein